MSRIQKFLYELATGKIRGPLAWFLGAILYCFSLIYGLFVLLLMKFYQVKPFSPGCKVISVGNITLGGTGKTTLVEYIAVYLKERGHKVAILSRGYKKISKGISSGAGNIRQMGDEPYMLAQKLAGVPVIVDSDGVRAARKAVKEFGVDTLILDDGLQQWRIAKDLEIVTIDASNPFGNSRVLPAGFLRQPLFTLKEADIFLITQAAVSLEREDLRRKLQNLSKGALIVESVHRPCGFGSLDKTLPLVSADSLKGKRLAAFCGIGNPEGFYNLLTGLGLDLTLFLKFEDHHNYTQDDLDKVIAGAKEKRSEIIVTTEKDAVKLSGLKITGCSLLVLLVKLALTKNEAEFNSRLLKLYPL